MSKQVSIESHSNGDSDGLGCARGFLSCLAIEITALAVFGAALYFFWS